MKKMLVTILSFYALASGALAQAHAAKVEPWAQGLSAPQGIVVEADGRILIVENGAGRVTRFKADGTRVDVAAEGLKAPSWALRIGDSVFVAEREGNSIARIRRGTPLDRLPGEVVDPLGIAADPDGKGGIWVVSHKQSLAKRFVPGKEKGELTLAADPGVTAP